MQEEPRYRIHIPITILAIFMSLVVLGHGSRAGKNGSFGAVPVIKVDPGKAALGKRLFFDPRLSGDATISCATCHQPDNGFADGEPLAEAYPGSLGFRNAPSLINTAHRTAWFWDGRIGTNLNDVTRESITEDWMMNMDMRMMQERLKQDSVYVKMFKDAGYGEPSNGAVRKAIPEFLKTLTSRRAPFDRGKMSAEAESGFELFKGKAGCVQCHGGLRFTDDQPHNIGVPDNPAIWNDPLRHSTYVAFGLFMGIENIMNLRRDVGAHVRSHKADGSDIGKFMTPGLRDLKLTGPYMHNGTFDTLKAVVAFYNKGGGKDANKDARIKPLDLSKAEQADLVAFLEALSGDPLVGDAFVWKDDIPDDYPAIKQWRGARN